MISFLILLWLIICLGMLRFVEIEPGGSPTEFAALITWDAGGQDKSVEKSVGVAVLPNSGHELQPEHFDQASIADLATLKERKINFAGTSNYSFFKILSALNSALLKSAISVEKPGQWYFVKIDLDVVPETPYKLELELVTVSPNQEITKSAIQNAGKPIGNIYFAWN